MMTASVDFPDRNQQILRMSQNGMTRRDIADRFGLTRNRVAQIVQRLTAEQELEIIDGISNLPLGENCRREWARRLTSLKH